MAKKKKGARMLVALVCTESGTTNYVTEYNKMNTPKIELSKYCPKLRKHTVHKMKIKLK